MAFQSAENPRDLSALRGTPLRCGSNPGRCLTLRGVCVHHTAMSAFLLALLAALAVGIGARDQLLVAWMAARPGMKSGAGFGLLMTAIGAALLSAGLAGWAGMLAAPQLAAPARNLLAAMALGLAALELLVLRPGRRPAEPTASLGALGVVLLAQQVTDAARLLVFALAASSAAPQLAVLGGMLGCAGTAVLGWSGGDRLAALPLTPVRRALSVLLAAIAVFVAI